MTWTEQQTAIANNWTTARASDNNWTSEADKSPAWTEGASNVDVLKFWEELNENLIASTSVIVRNFMLVAATPHLELSGEVMTTITSEPVDWAEGV